MNPSPMPETRAEDRFHEHDPISIRVQEDLLFVARALLVANEDSPMNKLPLSQVRCITIVAEEDGMKMAQLASRLNVKLPAASRIAHRLEARGLFDLRNDPIDKRVVRVSLSETGIKMYSDTVRLRTQCVSCALSVMDEKDVTQLTESLRVLRVATARMFP